MGPSPNHSRSVGLVLNPRTGHVSPQYHIKQDDFFETATGKPTDFDAPEPIWKRLAGLDRDPSLGQGKAKGKASIVFPFHQASHFETATGESKHPFSLPSGQPGNLLCRRAFQKHPPLRGDHGLYKVH